MSDIGLSQKSKPTLLKRLLLFYLPILAVSLLGLGWYSATILEEFHYTEKEKDLEARAIFISEQLSQNILSDAQKLQSLTTALGNKTNTRITIVNKTGKVLADSDEDPTIMENHNDRPEVITARTDRTGYSIRYSFTLSQNMMYCAVTHEDGIVIRTSLPMTTLTETVDRFRKSVFLVVAFILIFAAGLSFYLSQKVVAPIHELTTGAERFASGNLEEPISIPDFADVNTLASTMNTMAAQLNDRINVIARQKEEQAAILSSMVEGVIALDEKGCFLSLNRAARDFFDLNSENVTGRKFTELIRHSELLNGLVQAQSSDEKVELDIQTGGASSRFLQTTFSKLAPESGSSGLVIVVNDVTRLKQLGKIRQDFIANISHELKTPITSILGYVETLQDGGLDSTSSNEFLDIIHRQSTRLNDIVQDLLKLSEIERKREMSDIRKSTENIVPIVESVLQEFKVIADKKGIELRLVADESLQADIDPQLFKSLVQNLVDNGVKYGLSDSDIELVITQNGFISISITNQCESIPEKEWQRLFERFYRLEKSRHRNEGGTGLGLAIVKHIAAAHGGTIEVAKSNEEGTTFELKLPA